MACGSKRITCSGCLLALRSSKIKDLEQLLPSLHETQASSGYPYLGFRVVLFSTPSGGKYHFEERRFPRPVTSLPLIVGSGWRSRRTNRLLDTQFRKNTFPSLILPYQRLVLFEQSVRRRIRLFPLKNMLCVVFTSESFQPQALPFLKRIAPLFSHLLPLPQSHKKELRPTPPAGGSIPTRIVFGQMLKPFWSIQ